MTSRPESQLGLKSLQASAPSLPRSDRQLVAWPGRVTLRRVDKLPRWWTAERRILPVRPNIVITRVKVPPTRHFRGNDERPGHAPKQWDYVRAPAGMRWSSITTSVLKMGLRRSVSKLSRPRMGRQYSSGSAHRPLKTPHSTVPRQSHQCSVWLDQMNSACASSGLSVPARNGSNGR